MRRQRRISEFGEAEFLSALFHNALRRLEGRALAVFPSPVTQRAERLGLFYWMPGMEGRLSKPFCSSSSVGT